MLVSSSAVAGRISYYYNFKGPSLVMDTACSSSGVAIDYARRSLQEGRCDLAIVCAVHCLVSPLSNIFLTKARLLSPQGRCATFASSADGYCRSEGYGVLVLERLSDATSKPFQRHLWGVIRGTAVNHNGTSNGMTAPSGLAQKDVIVEALREAQIDPSEVSYDEAHGTGTTVGDPVEMRALKDVFEAGSGHKQEIPLYVASGKTNIGHCEPSRYLFSPPSINDNLS